MPGNWRNFGGSIRKVALSLLALAVFAFSIQTKVALCKPDPQGGLASAKLFTEERSALIFQAIEYSGTCGVDHALLFAVVSFRHLMEDPIVHHAYQEAELHLLHPGRLDLHGVYSLHRPPPFSPSAT